MQISRQHCSCRIFVRAKADYFNFSFRLRATGFGPNWTLHRFSFILRFRNFFVFRFNSHLPAQIAPRSRLGLIRARALHGIQKFQARISAKNRSTSGNTGWIDEQPKDLLLSGIWGLLAFAVQVQHIWQKYGKGLCIIMLASVSFMGVLLMKTKRAEPVKVRGLRNCMVIIAACSLLFMLGSCWDRMGMCVAKQVWELIS
ncbi:uncharacterized protein LOC129287503 [Prosopis cineraria]|uniref:uncharacterized protein LOC129287503 n=1 Tax=Prosopis cineraria TaxID=364024 RepID=UPI00240F2A4D|nr:uncharacterized protein LOC129287503 [Prosopis cineraria]